MEVEARRKADLLDSLLFDPIGKQFVTIWKKNNLGPTLGLPTSWVFTKIGTINGIDIFALPMQRGRMTILCGSGGTDCV
jgi:hypothetical protein